MIGRRNIEKVLLAQLDKLPQGHALEIRTYKRNRSVLFVRQGDDVFRVVQNGFEQADHMVEQSDIKKAIRRVLAKEFPRSNKVRVYALGAFDPDIDMRKHFKII